MLAIWRENITKEPAVANLLDSLAAAALWSLRSKCYSHKVSLKPDTKQAQVQSQQAMDASGACVCYSSHSHAPGVHRFEVVAAGVVLNSNHL
jgi:hypothetical protein